MAEWHDNLFRYAVQIGIAVLAQCRPIAGCLAPAGPHLPVENSLPASLGLFGLIWANGVASAAASVLLSCCCSTDTSVTPASLQLKTAASLTVEIIFQQETMTYFQAWVQLHLLFSCCLVLYWSTGVCCSQYVWNLPTLTVERDAECLFSVGMRLHWKDTHCFSQFHQWT